MTSIDPAARLKALLLRQARDVTKSVGTPRGAATSSPANTASASRTDASAQPSRAQAQSNLAAIVTKRIGEIGADDAARPRKALRIFLEEILLRQLDSAGHRTLLNDPGFHHLVTTVHERMEGDTELARLMADAANRMLAGEAIKL